MTSNTQNQTVAKTIRASSFLRNDMMCVPLFAETMDKAVSFMVIHNLDIQGVNSVFEETERVLKPDGVAVFLTMHPEILDSEDWDLDYRGRYRICRIKFS